MTTIDQRLPAVLRRRAKDYLELLGMDDGVAPAEATRRSETLIKAANEIEERELVATDPERLALNALADNRRLRKALQQIQNAMQQATASVIRDKAADFQAIAGQCRNALNAVEAPGPELTIIGLEIRPHAKRDELERMFAEAMDRTFPSTGTEADRAIDALESQP